MTEQLVETLPIELVERIFALRDRSKVLFEENLLKVQGPDKSGTPRMRVIINMPARGTVQVWFKMDKPNLDPTLEATFVEDPEIRDEHGAVVKAGVAPLHDRLHALSMSWEQFFERVVANG